MNATGPPKAGSDFIPQNSRNLAHSMADPPISAHAGNRVALNTVAGILREKGCYTNRCKTPGLNQHDSPAVLGGFNPLSSDYDPKQLTRKNRKAKQSNLFASNTKTADSQDYIPNSQTAPPKERRLDRFTMKPCGHASAHAPPQPH